MIAFFRTQRYPQHYNRRKENHDGAVRRILYFSKGTLGPPFPGATYKVYCHLAKPLKYAISASQINWEQKTHTIRSYTFVRPYKPTLGAPRSRLAKKKKTHTRVHCSEAASAWISEFIDIASGITPCRRIVWNNFKAPLVGWTFLQALIKAL